VGRSLFRERDGSCKFRAQTVVSSVAQGTIRDRRYGERHSKMQAFEFDPSGDIALGDDGCWRWNSDKKALHSFVRSYFELRNEDGGPE
jgi:hypothetical protein